MNATFWIRKWERGEIGFHAARVNRHLLACWSSLDVPPDTQVLVPLCGKTLDLRHLASLGHRVTGVELSPLACAAYYQEQDLPFTRQTDGPFEVFAGEGVRIYCGDYYDLSQAQTGSLGSFYDRAALAALPPDERGRYVEKLAGLLTPGARGLVVAFTYPEREKKGPPFTLPSAEMNAVLAPHFDAELLYEEDIIDQEPRFRQRWGLTALSEQVYRVVRRP